MTKNFEAIIFDLGGVLYDVDTQLSVDAFDRLGLKDFDGLYSLKEQAALFDALETGDIDEQTFVDQIRRIADKPLAHKDIIDAWNALLIGMEAEVLDILDDLRK